MRKYRVSYLLAVLAGLWALSAAATEPPLLRGELVQGGVVYGTAAEGSTIELAGQRVSISEDGRFALGFDRDAPKAMMLIITAADGSVSQHSLQVAPREYRIQKIEGIAKKIMSPSDADLKRIRSESAATRAARAQIIARGDFAADFQWPLTGPITGVFGSQRVYNGVPGRPHYGVDVAAATGTPITTPAPGVVTLAHDDMFYSGGTLIIDHGHGLSSTMLHLSKLLVKVGDEVKPGDMIAEVGATGRATGPHLDWRMNWFKSRVDPQLLVPSMPVPIK